MHRNLVNICNALILVFFALWGVLFPACSHAPDEQMLSLAQWHNNQGVVYMDQHNYTRAAVEFSQAIEALPNYAIGHANLGIAQYSLGKYDSATVALKTALEHDPELLQAHYTLGLIYNAQGKDHEEAIASLQFVAQAAPRDPHVLYYLSQLKGRLGYGEEAVAMLQKVIDMDPYNISAYYALANQYRRLERLPEWRETLDTFSQLSQAGYSGVSTSYQGQGMYAEAIIDVGGADPEFDDTRISPVFSPAGRTEEAAGDIRFASAADWNDNGRTDLLVLAEQLSCYQYDHRSSTLSVGARPDLPAEFTPTQVLVADFDNSGTADLLFSGEQLVRLAADAPGKWRETQFFGPSTQRIFTADTDHDGDLDLVLSTDQGSQLWTNDGQGRFSDITEQAGLGAALTARQVIFSDFDNNRAIDILILGEERLQIFTNNRDGTFTEIAASLGLGVEGQWIDIAVEDFDQDGYMDLCLLDADGKLSLYDNLQGNRFTLRQTLDIPLAQVRGLLPLDLDNDGDLDLAVFGQGGIHLLTYQGNQFHLEDSILFADQDIRHCLALDFDADGRIDLWADGQLLHNQTAGGNWLTIAAQGQGSNRDAIGAKVEVKTINRMQKREVRSRGPMTFGLAAADTVEFVRILWPGGVRQAELASPANERLTITEVDRKGTSCPIVYAWDGERFRFVTDINGAAIVGYLTAPGEYNTPDPDEYIRLGPIAPKDGYYTIKLANHLEEVIYVDALELLAVDHLPGLEIYPNERLLSAPPYPEFEVYALRDLRPLQAAQGHYGEDILAQLTHIDDDWYDGFALTDIHGYAEEFSIVLDLGDLSDNPHPVLLAYGWVDYAHSTSNWAAAQRGWSLSPLRVEVPGADGQWRLACADMGTPAGLPKHMVFDLAELFPTTDYRLRITTNRVVYWDQFLVGARADAPRHIHRRAPDQAELSWRGYPEHTSIQGTFAFRYHYDRLNLEAPWSTHRGAFTRFGPVEQLVRTADNRFAIMAHGDEVTAQFAAAEFPELEPGLERSFLLYSVGFGKDMDFHSAHSLTVEPLPFHEMSSYPYPRTESYPQTQAQLEYRLEYNTRILKGHF